MKNLGRKNKKRGDWPRFAWDESWKKPASAGYRPFSSEMKKKPLNPCGVVRGVITKVPFSLLLGAEAAILSGARRAHRRKDLAGTGQKKPGARPGSKVTAKSLC
jgi:hypothetical protein